MQVSGWVKRLARYLSGEGRAGKEGLYGQLADEISNNFANDFRCAFGLDRKTAFQLCRLQRDLGCEKRAHL
jgi:hypothetical protein